MLGPKVPAGFRSYGFSSWAKGSCGVSSKGCSSFLEASWWVYSNLGFSSSANGSCWVHSLGFSSSAKGSCGFTPWGFHPQPKVPAGFKTLGRGGEGRGGALLPTAVQQAWAQQIVTSKKKKLHLRKYKSYN